MKKRPRTIYLVKRLEALIRTRLEAALNDLALTPGQYTTLSVVQGEAISSASLARRVGITPQSMSEVIATLERKSLITRTIRDDNRRIADIALTSTGQALFRDAEQSVDRLERDLFDRLATAEEESLRHAIEFILN